MSETDFKKYAVETMKEVAKLLISLSSGFLVLSVTLMKYLSDLPNDPVCKFWTIVICWITLILSIGLGILSLGSIATSAHDENEFNVDDSMTKWLLKGQQILFIVSFIFFVIYAYNNV